MRPSGPSRTSLTWCSDWLSTMPLNRGVTGNAWPLLAGNKPGHRHRLPAHPRLRGRGLPTIAVAWRMRASVGSRSHWMERIRREVPDLGRSRGGTVRVCPQDTPHGVHRGGTPREASDDSTAEIGMLRPRSSADESRLLRPRDHVRRFLAIDAVTPYCLYQRIPVGAQTSTARTGLILRRQPSPGAPAAPATVVTMT